MELLLCVIMSVVSAGFYPIALPGFLEKKQNETKTNKQTTALKAPLSIEQ